MPDPTLGSGQNTAVIYARGGERFLFNVPAVAQLEWNRVLDTSSRATVTCTPAAADRDSVGWRTDDCAGLLATIHPWACELVMYRDGQRVWEGPVRRAAQTRGGVTIVASDVLGWTERRVVAAARTADGVVIRTEAAGLITAAFADDDPGVLVHVTELGGTGGITNVDFKPGSYYDAALSDLIKAGLYVSVVGRRIVLWSDPTYQLGRTNILNPSRHLAGDIETAREGDDLATRFWMANDTGETGAAGGEDAFYGLVERAASASGITGGGALDAAAATQRALVYPAPDSLTLPAGATLSCDAPFPMEALIPGVLTDVKVTDLCWPVEQTMMLTAVKVTQDDGPEKVGVTYQPLSSEAVD